MEKIDDYRWLVPQTGGMRTDGLIYASAAMLPKIKEDKAVDQVVNVAALPGIVGRSMAMPDIHWGYGFPIGGVAATNLDDGVISPGGVGYDISCGVRLIRTNLKKELIGDQLVKLVDSLFRNVPSGVGSTGKLNLSPEEVRQVMQKGAKWAVSKGFGEKEDLETVEDEGCIEGADPYIPSHRAVERGREQLGTLGSGNHFLEIQVVDDIYDEDVSHAFGLFKGQITVMVHTGSRGLGYQICDDFLRTMQNAIVKYKINLPDRQLACSPLSSPEGKNYLSAMAAAANYARANRQIITHWVRETFMHLLGMNPRDLDMNVVYDVCHNIAKIEEQVVAGKKTKVCVHRKGATRAFPAGHPEVPAKYKSVGQPVLIPGTMGTASYVLVGTQKAMEETFGTTCHGAGRVMSRSQAVKKIEGHALKDELEQKGILIRTSTYKGLAEEAPFAYKNVDEVVETCHNAGISRKVARMRPLAVVKG